MDAMAAATATTPRRPSARTMRFKVVSGARYGSWRGGSALASGFARARECGEAQASYCQWIFNENPLDPAAVETRPAPGAAAEEGEIQKMVMTATEAARAGISLVGRVVELKATEQEATCLAHMLEEGRVKLKLSSGKTVFRMASEIQLVEYKATKATNEAN